MKPTNDILAAVRGNIDPVWRERQLIDGLRERDEWIEKLRRENAEQKELLRSVARNVPIYAPQFTGTYLGERVAEAAKDKNATPVNQWAPV